METESESLQFYTKNKQQREKAYEALKIAKAQVKNKMKNGYRWTRIDDRTEVLENPNPQEENRLETHKRKRATQTRGRFGKFNNKNQKP